MKRKLQLIAAVSGAFASAISVTPARAGVRQDFSLAFTTASPAKPTGMALHLYYRNPSDPNAKPPALTGLVIQLPSGTTFDTRAVTICTASDTQVQIVGPSACPDQSHLTTGSFTAITGVSPLDPFVATDLIYNGGASLIEDVVFPGTSVTAGVDRLRISGSSLTANPPATPGGPPDGRTVPRQIDFSIPAFGPLIETPPACPAEGKWTASSTATFADGRTETDVSTTSCTVPAADRASHRAPRVHHRRTRDHRGRHNWRHHRRA